MLKVEKKEEANGRWRRRRLDGRVCAKDSTFRTACCIVFDSQYYLIPLSVLCLVGDFCRQLELQVFILPCSTPNTSPVSQ